MTEYEESGLQVIIVNSTEVVRLGIVALLEKCGYSPQRSFDSCQSLLKEIDKSPGAVILVENSPCLDQENIKDVIRQTGAIVALIASSDAANRDFTPDFEKMVEEGIAGFLDLSEPLHVFLSMIENLALGNFVISRKFHDRLNKKRTEDQNSVYNILNERELEILNLVAQGGTNKEIGAILHISEHTVKSYVSQVLSKLDLKNRQQAAVYLTQSKTAS